MSWGIIVINWLTIGSAEAEANITTLMSQKTISSAERPLGLRTASRSREGSVMTSAEARTFQDFEVQSEEANIKRGAANG